MSVSEKIKVFCCDGCHCDLCIEIWERMRHYVMLDKTLELGLVQFGGVSDILDSET